MDPIRPSLESFAGVLSVGSLCLLGGFLILDGVTPIYRVVATEGGSAVWGVVAALPTLVISYVLGILAVTAANIVFSPIAGLHRDGDDEELVQIGNLGDGVVVQRFLELVRFQMLLEGCSVAFVVIAAGAFCEALLESVYAKLGWVLGLGAVILALLCPLFALRISAQRRSLMAAVADHQKQKGGGAEGV